MTKKSKKSKGASKDAPTGAQTSPLPDLPRVAAPDTSNLRLVYCVGVPDTFLARLVQVMMSLLWGTMSVAMLLVFIMVPADEVNPEYAHLAIPMICVCLVLVLMVGVLIWDSDRKCVAAAKDWFVVDEDGFRYGFGSKGDSATDEIRVTWQEIARVPNDPQGDVVSVEIGDSSSISQHALLFRLRLPSGGIVWQKFPFWCCVPPEYQRQLPLQIARRFRNSHDLIKALLYGMAVHCDGLRFDPMVFVHANVDPRTWQSMRSRQQEAKRYDLAGWIVFFAWCMGGWLRLVVPSDTEDGSFLRYTIVACCAILTIAVALRVTAEKWFGKPWGKLPPDLGDHPIVFTREGEMQQDDAALAEVARTAS